MAKTEMDMVRDILDWAVSAEQKLGLIRQVVGLGRAVPAASVKARARKRRARRKAAVAGPGRRATLWGQLKRMAPEKAKSLNYSVVTADQLESIIAEAKKG